MNIVTRFAPSPTGLLHVGNIRTALVNWLYARSAGGKFILRIDDTDSVRSKQLYVDNIMRDLQWLGLTWDEIFYQSARIARYEIAKQQLIANGRLYPCYETQEELEMKKKSLLSRNLPPIYDRSALKLTALEKEDFASRGIKPCWRFLVDNKEIQWQDQIKGQITFLPANLSDPIVIRGDGSMTYTLSSVVDDIELGITNIIRGEDHVSNSAIHIQLFEALQAKPPVLAHLSLLSTKEQEISKRLGGFDIQSLRELGIDAMSINSLLSKIGTSDPIKPYHSLSALVNDFNIDRFGKSQAHYSQEELAKLNQKLLHTMSYDVMLSKRLQTSVIDESFWEAVKHNINTLQELELWDRICNKILMPDAQYDYSFTSQAADLLPIEPWDSTTFNLWIAELKKTFKVAGKDLFLPIRKSLTGLENGPELHVLLPLLGYQRTWARLKGQAI